MKRSETRLTKTEKDHEEIREDWEKTEEEWLRQKAEEEEERRRKAMMRKPMEDPKRALPLLQKIQFFLELQEVIPGLIDSVSHIAQFVYVERGDVIFQQGDPPASLYYIVSGEVSVHVRNMEADVKPRLRSLDQGPISSKRCFCLRWGSQGQKLFEYDYETLEGFSTFCNSSSFGDQVATFGPGSTFASEALKNDDPRNVTVRCTKDCQLMFVHRNRFDLKLFEKFCFFREVPGFKDFRADCHPNDHPASIFQRQCCTRDQVLLREGQIERRVLYVIKSGTIAFCRTAKSKVGLKPDETSRCWTIMGAHSLFGSLGLLGALVTEPCSAVVASDTCELFKLESDSIKAFESRSPDILHSMIEAIVQGMKPVLRLSNSFAGCMFAQPPKSEPPVVLVDVDDPE